jgi:hypothetical protein
MRRCGSTTFTSTGMETPYISHSHCTRWPATSVPLPRVNQKREVISGSTNASNTSAAGRRMSIPVFTASASCGCGSDIRLPL